MIERTFDAVLKELHQGKKTGGLYVDMVEQSEDMLKVFFEKGEISFIKYGTAVGNDVLEILEYYNLYSASFYEGITAPGKPVRDLPPTETIIKGIEALHKKIKV
jgi:hypothetical protein